MACTLFQIFLTKSEVIGTDFAGNSLPLATTQTGQLLMDRLHFSNGGMELFLFGKQ
jgi:hypothetical protein